MRARWQGWKRSLRRRRRRCRATRSGCPAGAACACMPVLRRGTGSGRLAAAVFHACMPACPARSSAHMVDCWAHIIPSALSAIIIAPPAACACAPPTLLTALSWRDRLADHETHPRVFPSIALADIDLVQTVLTHPLLPTTRRKPHLQPVSVQPVLPGASIWGRQHLVLQYANDPQSDVQQLAQLPEDVRRDVAGGWCWWRRW